ncbi:hypothetical protein A3I48_02685 [Candidatus Daviesbacteria bacterium RIFCSPLOWO2_02_FULL_36_7]|uniref:Twin-arginine translocation signal domain-containing protein n=1 Tax=Candidatus Daviesbacteria bacterium RIFCSPLOWO2_02_FULL_36_7 TaxID=1797792 RepID=A0A1F5MI62_9BACT|nr:MAG: hypothetical protein A3I48_02685 [Candidatus Daviesbacteria bacterium RIFCSPLOWO2_02_FULL_36_7]
MNDSPEDSSKGISRKQFLKGAALIGAGVLLGKVAPTAAKTVVDTATNLRDSYIDLGGELRLKIDESTATTEQKNALIEFKRLKEEARKNSWDRKYKSKIITILTTGEDGAKLRTKPQPPTDVEMGGTEVTKLDPFTNYKVEAILIKTDNRRNPSDPSDWYYIVTSDKKTGEPRTGFFSAAQNFINPASVPQTPVKK